VSDQSQGPGWWQASDGKWYPPEAASGSGPATNTNPGWSTPGVGAPGPGVPGPVSAGLGPNPYPTGSATPDTKGFIKSLYDFKFDYFVTPKVLRFFYAFFVIVWSIVAVIMLIAFLSRGGAGVIVGIIFVPIAYLAYIILTRMYFELVAAFFRLADDLRAIRRKMGA